MESWMRKSPSLGNMREVSNTEMFDLINTGNGVVIDSFAEDLRNELTCIERFVPNQNCTRAKCMNKRYQLQKKLSAIIDTTCYASMTPKETRKVPVTRASSLQDILSPPPSAHGAIPSAYCQIYLLVRKFLLCTLRSVFVNYFVR